MGEPGVGKSRLFWEFTRSPATDGWLVLESGSVSYGKATPYLPVIELLKSYFKIEDQDAPREIREKVSAKLLDARRRAEAGAAAFLALLDVPIDDATGWASTRAQRRQQTLDAVAHLLLRESRAQPLALVLRGPARDRRRDAGRSSTPWSRACRTARVLLLVNYRPEYRHGWGSKTFYVQLRIDPLSPETRRGAPATPFSARMPVSRR